MNTAPHNPIHINTYAASDRGQQRENNEDQWVIMDLTTGARGLVAKALDHDVGPRGTLLAVADGLGGAPGGELASALAMESLLRSLRVGPAGPTILHLYHRAIIETNRWIWDVAQAEESLTGMGATLTTALIYHSWVYLAQVGDSRAYLIRDHHCHQITEDQSLLDTLVTTGQLSATEARAVGGRNVVLQALGTKSDVQIAITEVGLKTDDCLVLCTDGLSRLVPAEEICQVVTEATTLSGACEALVRLANDRGGPDNITVVAARVTSGPDSLSVTQSPLTLHRLTVFDPSEILRRHPELETLVLFKAKERRRRFYLLIALVIILLALLALLTIAQTF